eukprot:5314-Heterococcus_DN1.PRE.5
MDALKAVAKRDGEEARARIPGHVEGLNDFIVQSFGGSVEQAEASFAAALSKAGTTASANESLSALLSAVRSQTAVSINLLLALHRWILAHVPIIEDGNNFGVGVQQEVAKLLRESVEKLEKAFDTLPEYHEKRAAAWEKLAAKSEKTSKKTESKNSSKGGKDGDESKQSTSEESSESTSQSVQSPDGLKALLALDVRCYVSLHRTAQLSRDLVLFCTDMVEQNVSKIVAPKGEAHRGGAPGVHRTRRMCGLLTHSCVCAVAHLGQHCCGDSIRSCSHAACTAAPRLHQRLNADAALTWSQHYSVVAAAVVVVVVVVAAAAAATAVAAAVAAGAVAAAAAVAVAAVAAG